MRVLTLDQPWATLIALGIKTIETRGWSTDYRGPLAIHAGKKRPANFHHHNVNDDLPPWIDLVVMSRYWDWWEHDDFHHGGTYRWRGPLGCIVAVVDLVDVVPIVDEMDLAALAPYVRPCVSGLVYRRQDAEDLDDFAGVDDVTDQFPFGDFTPDRFAWITDNPRPLSEPLVWRGAPGLRGLPDEVAREVEART